MDRAIAAIALATALFGLAGLPVIAAEASGSDSTSWCLKTNPSCGRDPWWAEWSQPQQSQLVPYPLLAPGFVSEERFVEVVRLLWQWPEGKALLETAAEHDVLIVAGAESGAYASYSPQSQRIQLNERFTETSTWMVADVIAHELKHASDHAAGKFDSASYSDCITREHRAYAVEQRFLYWIWNRFGGFPSRDQVVDHLTAEDLELYDNLMTISYSTDLGPLVAHDYLGHC
jgi:hypothetical protein